MTDQSRAENPVASGGSPTPADTAEDRVLALMASLEESVKDARAARLTHVRKARHPDPDRMWATVYERAAWHHDIGEHDGSEYPYEYCPRCEMVHPLGRFQVLLRAALDVLASVGDDFLVPPTLASLEQLREAVHGKR